MGINWSYLVVGFITGTIIIYLYKVIDRNILKRACISVFKAIVKVVIPILIAICIYVFALFKFFEWFDVYGTLAVVLVILILVAITARYLEIRKNDNDKFLNGKLQT